MSEQVYRDFLTGIYNRNWLFEKSPVLEEKKRFSLLYMDLDNFKTVNDVYGHEEGDRVLKCAADALSKSGGEEGYPVRMSGDEFVLLFSSERTRDEITEIYGQILREIFKSRTEIPGISVISVSAGAVTSDTKEDSLTELLKMGDETMYAAKRSGKRRCVFFEDIRERTILEHRIADEAPDAVKNDRFTLEFLPLLNMQSSMLELTHVVAVWNTADGKRRLPSDYRPVLENNGYIRDLDLFLLEKLFQVLHKYKYSGGMERKLKFSIVLSRLLFLDRQLENSLKDFFETYGVTPDELDISVTELALGVRDTERMIFGMKRIADLGVTLSLFRFGANFISIRYINTMPISTVYFDSEWLLASLKEKQSRKTVRSIVRLIKDARNKIVVMGELDAEDKRFLARSGCDAMGELSKGVYFQPEHYAEYIGDKLPKGAVSYAFLGNLLDTEGENGGRFLGNGVTFVPGISDKWGALHFSGGEIGENVVELPPLLFASNSYTVSFWIYPEEEVNWGSVVYMRYEGGFTSYVPYTNANDGISCFRISDDGVGFFDTHCRAMKLNEWCHIIVAYDASDESVRYFINGRKGNMHINMPNQIGCRQVLLGGDPFQRTYVGYLSGLRIYDYAISDDDMVQMYEEYTKEPGYKGVTEDYWMETE
ncbi:MAG: diguanylate cyclase [Lachnospiraceae bacterium]|nr:diguanylate cyclase [Lachnospiraceae bacterium]